MTGAGVLHLLPVRHAFPILKNPLLPQKSGKFKKSGFSGQALIIMNTLEIKGDWNIIKGRLKQKWAMLTDDDLHYVEGKQDELLGRIQKVTGETREAIEKALKEAGF